MSRSGPLSTIEGVVAAGLCSGCGACVGASKGGLRMIDEVDYGLRPVPSESPMPGGTESLVPLCPGAGLRVERASRGSGAAESLGFGWGPVVQVWEGHASDPEIRRLGSSGGAATALSLFAVERQGVEGVVHVGASDQDPVRNETVVSRTRDALIRNTGSRYSPASPCEILGDLRDTPGPFVFVGKPCDAAAVSTVASIDGTVDSRISLVVAFFCAGTPSTAGTLEMLRRMGVADLGRLQSLRYRGDGWPGSATASFLGDGGGSVQRALSYEESWGEVLTNFKQMRCKLCPDHTGEFSDISVGDPWYREISEGEPGSSLIVARTSRGANFLREAVEAGYLDASPVDTALLPASQPNLLREKAAVWGRVVTLRMFGVAAPHFQGLTSFRLWWEVLSFRQKISSTLGTARRIMRNWLAGRRGADLLSRRRGTDARP